MASIFFSSNQTFNQPRVEQNTCAKVVFFSENLSPVFESYEWPISVFDQFVKCFFHFSVGVVRRSEPVHNVGVQSTMAGVGVWEGWRKKGRAAVGGLVNASRGV